MIKQIACSQYIDKRRDGSTLKRSVIKKTRNRGFLKNTSPLIFLAMQAEAITSERSSSVTTSQIITRIRRFDLQCYASFLGPPCTLVVGIYMYTAVYIQLKRLHRQV